MQRAGVENVMTDNPITFSEGEKSILIPQNDNEK